MPISSTTRKAGPFLGNDSTSTFPFAFKVFSTSDLAVSVTNALNATDTLTLDSDYTVTLNPDQETSPGGEVDLVDTTVEPAVASPLPEGSSLTIRSAVPSLQLVDLTNQGGFYPEVITTALDRLTILVQQLEEKIKELQLIVAGPVPDGLFAGQLLGDVDGENTVFQLTLNGTPLNLVPHQMIVWCNYPLIEGVGYTLGPEAGQVTFAVAPKSDDSLYAQGVL